MHGRISRDDSIQLRSARGFRARRAGPRLWARGAALSAVALAHWGAACVLVVWAQQGGAGGMAVPRAIGLVVLAGLGAAFGVAAYRDGTAPGAAGHVLPLGRRAYWQSCGALLVVCYALALVVGDHPAAPYVFATSLALGHATVWHALRAAPHKPTHVVRLLRRPPLRFAAWTIFLLLMTPLAAELGLRVYALAADDLLMSRYVIGRLQLPPGGERLGQTVNSQGYWDDEFPIERIGSQLRVAALGDEMLLCGNAESNFLAQVERIMPGAQVLNFGVPEASPREYAAQLETAVAACRPDAVLVCVSVATDITEAPPLPGAFDWRSLHLVQRSLGLSEREGPCRDAALSGSNERSGAASAKCLDEAARGLDLCRVPVEEPLQARWREVYDQLDGLARRSRDLAVTPILVAIPCEFQTDERLCETLCRRAGYRQDEIDVDLPQRRLAAYAKDRGIQMLDLTPHLRASRAPSYCCDGPDLNRHGNSVAAVVLSEWLESQYGTTLLASGR